MARALGLQAGLFAFILHAAVPACTVAQEAWPDPEWEVATLEEQELDGNRIGRLVDLVRTGGQYPDLHSLLIVRNGYLVLEEYFGGHNAQELHTLQSVSKSVTSAVMGIAIEQGHIRGIDEHTVDFFPEWREELSADSRRAEMRLEDLLTMRSGTDYREGFVGSPHNQLNSLARGWDRFYLDRPMVREPGTYFQYDSGGVILMSSMLQRRAGLHADAFAAEHLFAPIGITRTRWFRNQEGHPHTGGGLHLTSRDMARFGLLFLRAGRWQDRQVVPTSWVETSTRIHVTLEGRGRTVGYGYLWWILQPDPNGATGQHLYAAMGFRAQYIFVVPEHDMVVVVTGGTSSQRDQIQPVLFLYSDILPAVMR